jgi:ABC-type lipoprotein export system ATPase subunit
MVTLYHVRGKRREKHVSKRKEGSKQRYIVAAVKLNSPSCHVCDDRINSYDAKNHAALVVDFDQFSDNLSAGFSWRPILQLD